MDTRQPGQAMVVGEVAVNNRRWIIFGTRHFPKLEDVPELLEGPAFGTKIEDKRRAQLVLVNVGGSIGFELTGPPKPVVGEINQMSPPALLQSEGQSWRHGATPQWVGHQMENR